MGRYRKVLTTKGRVALATLTLRRERTPFLRQYVNNPVSNREIKCLVYAELLRRRQGVR
jgi:hypothetical protein